MKIFTAVFALLLICLNVNAQVPKSVQQLELALPSKKDTARINALNRLGWEYRRTDTQKAIHYGERAEQLSRAIRYWRGLAYSNKNLGAAWSVSGNYAKARIYLKKAMQQFSELNDHSETGNIHNLFGLMYWETGEYDSSLVSYDLAMKEYKRAGDLEGVAIVYSNTGIIYYETGKYDRALKQYGKGLELAESHHEHKTLASIHSNIGLIYAALGDYPKSLYHQQKSAALEQENENPSGRAKSFTNIGVCYYFMHNPDSSLAYHNKALRIYGLIGEKKGIARSLLNIGSIYEDRKDYAKAIDFYQRTLKIEQQISDKLGATIALTHLGSLRAAEGKNSEAIAYLEEAYIQAYRLHSLLYQTRSSLLLAELNEQAGNAEKAMDYYKIYTAANDNLLREKSSPELLRLLVGFATKGKQREIHSLRAKNRNANSQKTLIAVTASLLIAITGLAVVLIRKKHRREKLQLEAEVAVNKAALMDYTRRMIEKNAELAQLQERLQDESENPEGAETVPENDDTRIETLNQLSGSRIVTDEDWEEFKKLFTRVHPRFMLRLKEQFSGITQAELRLAALITLQLSSKEIAAMLGISGESVKKTRQRLRRRLELRPEEELDAYLSELAGS